MIEKKCSNCIWIKRFTSEDGEWIDVCSGECPDEQDDGLYLVTTIDQEQFDPSLCLLYKVKEINDDN